MKISNIHILLIGFFISFAVFFIHPVFFASAGMNYFQYVPSFQDSIGVDLAQNINYSKTLLGGKSPYVGNNLYPPITSVLFIPFTFVNFHTAYLAISVITFIAIISMFVLACKINNASPEMILVFITGIISYGFQFEIERGQFYTISMAFCMWALYLVHFTKYRKTAYALFTLAVQLKIFPIFFIWMMVKKNWRDLLLLAEINFALLFCLGYKVFYDFLIFLKHQASQPTWVYGNHSIRSYTHFIQRGELYPFIAIAIIIGWFYTNYKSKGFNTLTILYCTLIGSLVPPISNDYTLPTLVLPMILLFQEKHSGLVLFFISLAYSSMLFSYATKTYLVNNALALLIITGLTLYLIWKDKHSKIEKV